MSKTTMDKLAPGARFYFGHGDRPNHPGFEKVSNLYARDLKTGTVNPNEDLMEVGGTPGGRGKTASERAAALPVTYLGPAWPFHGGHWLKNA